MTDLPTPDAEPTDEQLDQAREDRAAAAREQAERDAEARDAETQEVWALGQEAARRAEAMGDHVDVSPETGIGSSSRQE